ncbi:MAG: Asp-tRNA(Asn)/Glu-tRNA(Gln) amidotransferase subunit GatB [Hyphomicrobiales bacterium]
MNHYNKDFHLKVGLEVHLQVKVGTKAFSQESYNYGEKQNTCISAWSVGMPGVLPSPSLALIESGIKLGLAMKSRINRVLRFSRKNYFYTDLPKGYQLTQTDPLCIGGELRFVDDDNKEVSVPIKEIHLEEDSGKSIYKSSKVFVDYNRSGVALLEVVTEPCIYKPEHASLFLIELRKLVRWLGVSDGDMEKGSLRCDVNVSVVSKDKDYNRTEIKNLNSFTAVRKSIITEYKRQLEVIESGRDVKEQTLSFDMKTSSIKILRDKSSAMDYRYINESDILPVRISEEKINTIQKELSVLPYIYFQLFYSSFGFDLKKTRLITEDRGRCLFLNLLIDESIKPNIALNWVLGHLMELERTESLSIGSLNIEELVVLLKALQNDKISFYNAKVVFSKYLSSDDLSMEKALSKVLSSSGNKEKLKEDVKLLLSEHPDKVKQYLDGKETLVQFFVGQVMRYSKGMYDPKEVKEIVEEELKSYKSK